MEIRCFFGKTLVDITKFVNENGLLPHQILGLQYSKNDSVVVFYFDVSDNIQNRESAIKIGKSRKKKIIRDLNNNLEIKFDESL